MDAGPRYRGFHVGDTGAYLAGDLLDMQPPNTYYDPTLLPGPHGNQACGTGVLNNPTLDEVVEAGSRALLLVRALFNSDGTKLLVYPHPRTA